MTAPLRRTHGLVWAVLAVALPLLLAASLSLRPETTPVNPHFRLP